MLSIDISQIFSITAVIRSKVPAYFLIVRVLSNTQKQMCVLVWAMNTTTELQSFTAQGLDLSQSSSSSTTVAFDPSLCPLAHHANRQVFSSSLPMAASLQGPDLHTICQLVRKFIIIT